MTANASTGPRSAEGKARSSRNALKSGIYAKSLIIPGEDPDHLDTLRDEYFQRYCPAFPEQRDQVDILVRSTWTLRRLAVAETQVLTYTMSGRSRLDADAPLGHTFSYCDTTLTRLQRIVNSTQRNFRDALHELERLQSLPINFEPAPAPAVEPVLPPESPTPSPAPPTQVSPQSVEPKPVNPSGEFVSSTSADAPTAARTAAPNLLPYHQPGISCRWSPVDPFAYRRYKQCVRCFPNQELVFDDRD